MEAKLHLFPVHQSSRRKKSAPADTSGRFINILIVDDEPKNLTVLETVLDAPDYRLVLAESAEQALLALLADEFAILILDIQMPGCSGLELARIIKEREKTSQIPIIFLTAYYNDDQHVIDGYGAGAIDYLHKPINPVIMRSKVAVLAELHRKQRELQRANLALLAEITERREVQEQLHTLNETLEQRVLERTEAHRRGEETLRESEERLRLALAASNAGVWTWLIETGEEVWSAQNFVLHGVESANDAPTYAEWQRTLHPDDVKPTTEAIEATIEGRAAEYRAEYRVVHPDGDVRWLLAVGKVERDADGKPRKFTGLNLDITTRKRAEEHAALVTLEVNHRAKNLLAVVQAVARLSAAKSVPGEFARRFGERLSGLAASHDLLVRSEWRSVDIGELVRSQLAHFAGLIGARITLKGAVLLLTPAAAQGIGMALHELATNAGKHGALSDPAGSVRVSWELAGEGRQKEFAMTWSERDGPPCLPPKHKGFGHTVIVNMVEQSLDAKVLLTYPASGLVWRLSTAAACVLYSGGAEPVDSWGGS